MDYNESVFVRVRVRIVPKRKTSKFSFYQCPSCETLYQRVRSRVGTGNDPEIACNACSAPLPTRDGEFALKYFMLREAARAQVRGTLTRFDT
jgi:hypothetical protein